MASIRSERGRLFLGFRWKGVRCREWTGRSDTPTDRAELKKLIRQIDGEIAAGTFEYIKRFPEGSRRNAFAPPSSLQAHAPPHLRRARQNLDRKSAPLASGGNPVRLRANPRGSSNPALRQVLCFEHRC